MSFCFHQIIRFSIALSIVTGPFATYADDSQNDNAPVRIDVAEGDHPAMSFTLQGQDGPVTVIVAIIPKDNEAEFIHQQVQDKSGKPLAIVYSQEDGAVADEIDQDGPNHPELTLLKINQEELATAKETEKLLPLSLKTMRDASILVITFNLGILATPLYFSSSTAGAFLATFGFISAQVIANDRYRFVTDYITWSSKKFQNGAQRYFPDSPFAAKLGLNAGRVSASMSYSLFSNSVTRFLMNDFDIKASVGSAAGLTNIGTSAVTSFFTSSIWDILFARLRSTGVEEDAKIAQLMVWVKTLYLFTVSPLMLSQHTRIEGFTAMIAFGALGFYANHNERPFVNVGRFVLNKMETSEKFSRIFTNVMGVQKAVADKFSRMTNAVTSPFKKNLKCEKLFVE